MKKLRMILIIASVCIFCTALAACNKAIERLGTPTNLSIEKDILTWDEVEGADGYVVIFEDEEHETKECRYKLYALIEPKSYIIEVMAIGEGFSNSKCAKITHTVIYEEPTEGLSYQVLDDNTLAVSIGRAAAGGRIVIPDEYDGRPVTKISYFREEPMTSVRLPAHLKEIGEDAFSFCKSLEETRIPVGVQKIGNGAFSACKSLQEIEIPESVTEIGKNAFWGCEALSSVDFEGKVESLSESLFIGCGNLKDIKLKNGQLPKTAAKINVN